MKNKLFIIVACFSLMAICGTAGADDPGIINTEAATPASEMGTIVSSDSLETAGTLTQGMRINSFASETLLRAQRLDTCGNSVIDPGEECEFKDGVMIQSTDVRVGAFPSCDTENSERCNLDTCRCEHVPICGDGVFVRASEQCESQWGPGEATVTPEIIDKMCLNVQMVVNRAPLPLWFTPPPLAEGAHYVCQDCICGTCGNGVKDPGEDCDGTQGCNSKCKMAPEPVPEIICTQKETGALASDYIDELNAQGRAIMSEAAGKPVDVALFGEAVYSEILTQIEIPNSAVKGEVDEAVRANLTMSGDTHLTGKAFFQLGGPMYNDLSKESVMIRESLPKSIFLFPREKVETVSKGVKSQIGGNEVFVPVVTASLIGEVIDDLGSLGFRNMDLTVVDANQASFNGVMRFMVVPHSTPAVSKAEGQTAQQLDYTTAIFQAKAWYAPGGWGDSGGELIHHDPNQVLAALQDVVNQLKAEGRQSEIGCGIANLIMEQMEKKGQKYEPQMFSKFALVSDSLKVNPATGKVEMSDQVVQPYSWFSVPTEFGAGGAGTGPMSCSIATAQANAPQILVTLGMMVASLTGVGIIRRRKR